MLRSISKDVSHQLYINRSCTTTLYRQDAHFSRHVSHWRQRSPPPAPSFLPVRHYSPLNPTPSSHPKSLSKTTPPIIPTPPSRKPKVDLRPGPLKPKSLPPSTPRSSLSNTPVKSHPLSHPPQSLSLGAAKEEAQKDITDAEKHGILPPPPADANWFRQTLHQAIELAKFYYRGVKLIFSRRREIAAIRKRIKEGGHPLTRSEYRFIRTQKDDVNKVIPFLIIALLLEEIIPLIAIYAPFMLPSTCILPSQRARIEAKRNEKALASAVNSKAIFSALKSSGVVSLNSLKAVEGAPTAICSLLGLSSLGFDALRIRRIRKCLEFIKEDDQLLIQDHLHLSRHDTKEALVERGLVTAANSSAKEQAALLAWWLDSVRQQTEDGLSTRLALILSRH